MPASIIFDQTTKPAGTAGVAREDFDVGIGVTCSNATVETQYLWTLVDVPIRSALVRGTTGTSATFGFIPDVKGTYTVSLKVNGSALVTDNTESFCAVLSFGSKTLGWRYPAAGEERNLDNQLKPGLGFPGDENTRGWATEHDLQLEEAETAAYEVLNAVVVSPGIGADGLVKLDPLTGVLDPSVIPSGGGGVADLQGAYDGGVAPNISTTLARGPVTINRGVGADPELVELVDGDTVTLSADGVSSDNDVTLSADGPVAGAVLVHATHNAGSVSVRVGVTDRLMVDSGGVEVTGDVTVTGAGTARYGPGGILGDVTGFVIEGAPSVGAAAAGVVGVLGGPSPVGATGAPGAVIVRAGEGSSDVDAASVKGASTEIYGGDAIDVSAAGGTAEGGDVEIDTGTAISDNGATADGTIRIGTSNAAAIEVGRSGATAAVLGDLSVAGTITAPTGQTVSVVGDKAAADAIAVNASNASGGVSLRNQDVEVLRARNGGVLVTGNLEMAGGSGQGVHPDVADSKDLGSLVFAWRDVYARRLRNEDTQSVSVVGDKGGLDAIVINASNISNSGGVKVQIAGGDVLAVEDASVGVTGTLSVSGSVVVGGTVSSTPPFPVTESTTSRALSATDNGRVIRCTHASGCAVTVPDTLDQGFTCLLVQRGAGQVEVTGAGSMVLTPAATFDDSGTVRTAELGSAVCVVVESSTVANAFGDLEAV